METLHGCDCFDLYNRATHKRQSALVQARDRVQGWCVIKFQV
jgi:hypothetical protein